jgi:hypothetical protein
MSKVSLDVVCTHFVYILSEMLENYKVFQIKSAYIVNIAQGVVSTDCLLFQYY